MVQFVTVLLETIDPVNYKVTLKQLQLDDWTKILTIEERL